MALELILLKLKFIGKTPVTLLVISDAGTVMEMDWIQLNSLIGANVSDTLGIDSLNECFFHEDVFYFLERNEEAVTELFETGSAEFTAIGNYNKERKFLISISVSEIENT